MKKQKNILSRIIHFIAVDIWQIRFSELSGKKLFFTRSLMTIVLAVRRFIEDKCILRASALTIYSLLSAVPVIAVALGIAKGFGFEAVLETQITERLQGQPEIATWLIGFAHSLLKEAGRGIIAGVGIVLLFWAVIRMLSNIENSFNDIWSVKKGRNIGRRLSDYLAIMLISPILLIMPGSITIAISGHVQEMPMLAAVSPFILSMLRFTSYIAIWTLFTFIYFSVPNTNVNLKSALLGGIIAGTAYQFLQWGYVNLQMGVARFSAIYGTFAALPLFLIWLQISWLIVLFGAEISFAHQNAETYEFESDFLRISHFHKKLLSLRIVHLLVKNFSCGEKPLTAIQISHKLKTPIHLISKILYELAESNIVYEVKINEKTIAFSPAQSLEALTIGNVIERLEKRGSDNVPIAETKELNEISECLKTFDDTIKNSPANILLKNI